ncbi:MAG: hypothetical protein KHX84_24470 [Enterocloster asparagiformis]|nr:hypothetical protein [Enterocloster asparagiformis]
MEALQVSLGMIPKPDAPPRPEKAGSGKKHGRQRISLPPVRLLLFYGCV